jgi:hypothetical protein
VFAFANLVINVLNSELYSNAITVGELYGANIQMFPDDDDPQSCIISSQIAFDNQDQYTGAVDLFITQDIGNYLVGIYDSRSEDSELYLIDSREVDDLNNFVMVVLDGQAFVYLNGELIFSELEVEQTPGEFVIFLNSDSRRVDCEFSDIWIYSLDNRELSCVTRKLIRQVG